jgi:hypothetical protein
VFGHHRPIFASGSQHLGECHPYPFLIAALQVATELQPRDLHGIDILVNQELSQFIDHLLIRPDISGVKKRRQSFGVSSFLLILFSFFHKSNNSKQNEQKRTSPVAEATGPNKKNRHHCW